MLERTAVPQIWSMGQEVTADVMGSALMRALEVVAAGPYVQVEAVAGRDLES